jgi:pimeloyl-ACP methyl ester carboxylesterase
LGTAQLQKLETFKHYEIFVKGLSIGFIHERPDYSSEVVISILVLHGWPGSILEFLDVIPILTSCEETTSYEVITPLSLPGYRFSDTPKYEGFDLVSAAEVLLHLLFDLSNDKDVVHGGDWGSIIASSMAQIDGGNHIAGLHLTMLWHPYPWVPLLLAAATRSTPLRS